MKFDFIPVELYTTFYYYAIMFIVFVNFLKLQEGFIKSNTGLVFVWCIIIYMGLRPLSGKWFGDMSTYNKIFLYYQQGGVPTSNKDVYFQLFMKACSGIMTVDFFFLLCAFLYIYPLYLVSIKWFKEYWFNAFLLLVVSFSFWAYGVNGIRNGIAGSIFLYGMSREKKIWQVVAIMVAISVHKTMLLPTLGFVLAQFFNKPKYMIGFWLLCIPLSLVGGSLWEALFASLGFGDDRLGDYLTEKSENDKNFSSVGFRWDFLIYSATAIFAGYFFIVKKKFKDKIYFCLFNTYVFANAFWILVIRANYSNRFAYLSWFMMALVVAYPFLKDNLIKKQSRVFALILVLYFLFTFTMGILLRY